MEIKELIRKAGIRSNRKDINLSGFTEQCSQWLTSSLNAVRKLIKLGEDFGGLKMMKDGSIHYIAERFSPNVVFFANEDIRALYQRLKDKSCHVLRPVFPGEFESDRFIMIAVNFLFSSL